MSVKICCSSDVHLLHQERKTFSCGFSLLSQSQFEQENLHLELWASTSTREARSVVAGILEESCRVDLSFSWASVFFEEAE